MSSGSHLGARRPWWRRHRALVILLVMLAVLLSGILAVATYVDHQLAGISRFQLDVPSVGRPTKPAGAAAGDLNILVAGADNGDKGIDIASEIAAGIWVPGQHRSDTLMVVHITADRRRVDVVSIPRDSYVAIPGHGMDKINAAFSYGGPSLLVRTVEQFTGLRIDHLAIMDWNGFRDLATAVGGVRIYIPHTFYDPMHGNTWTQGVHLLSGDRALEYVRTRYGLPNGDFDRIQRQQNFIRELFRKLTNSGTFTSPTRFLGVLRTLTQDLTVDSSFTSGQIESLAWSLRGVQVDDVVYLTTPMARFGTTSAGASIVVPDLPRTRALFDALGHDQIARYLAEYGDGGELRPAREVR